MTDYQIFYDQIAEIAARFNRWMTFIEITEIAGLFLSITALIMLLVKIRKDRKRGRHI